MDLTITLLTIFLINELDLTLEFIDMNWILSCMSSVAVIVVEDLDIILCGCRAQV